MQNLINKFFSIERNVIFIIAACCLLLNFYIISKEYYFLILLPFIILVGVLYFIKFEYVLFLIAFFVPLSFTLNEQSIQIGINLPTEPMMVIATVLFWLNVIINKKLPAQVSAHAFFYLLLAILIWTGVTAITSTEVLISIKFLLAKIWFYTTAFFIPIIYFKDLSFIKKVIKALILGMLFASLYTIYNHARENFTEIAAHWVMTPLFSDHTSYAALLALILPLALYLSFDSTQSNIQKTIFRISTVILIIATILSYTRAAWVSLFAVLILYAFIYFGLKFKGFVKIVIFSIVVILINFGLIVNKIEKNDQDSSSSFTEHLQSITNISTDASNLERLNRWSCAVDMFLEKPFFGWGPNTYQFKYSVFQKKELKTIISTNTGDMGNAHSEYLGVLCEQGIFGLFIWLFGIILIFYYGFKNCHNVLLTKNYRRISLALLLSLTTYILHGFLNNFLDQDKLAFPFWLCVSALAAIDLHAKSEEAKILNTEI